MLLEKPDGKRTLLWVAEVRGKNVWIRSGRSGTKGKMTTLDSPSEDDARELLDREVTAKLAEGFVVVDEAHTVSDAFVARAERAAKQPAPTTTGIPKYLVDVVRAEVLGGFTDEDDIDQTLEDLILVNGETDDKGLPAKLGRLAAELYAAHRAAERTWTERTTNDAIDEAFEELNELGIVAIQNSGGSTAAGWSGVNAAARELAATMRPRGGTFYHGQDLEGGVRGEGLYLVFGAYEKTKSKHEAASVAIGHEIVAVLKRHGVATAWDGTVEQRIKILPFEWKRRRR